MPQRIQQKPSVIKVGEIRRPIQIIPRNIVSGGTNYDVASGDIVNSFARVDQISPVQIEQGINNDSSGSITHIFYMRYPKTMDNGDFIKWSGDFYKVKSFNPNINGERRFVAAYCTDQGLTSKKQGWA